MGFIGTGCFIEFKKKVSNINSFCKQQTVFILIIRDIPPGGGVIFSLCESDISADAEVILYSPLKLAKPISLGVSRISLRSNITRRKANITEKAPSRVLFLVPMSCCGARQNLRAYAFPRFCRPLPLARVAVSATGSAPLAPRTLTYGSNPTGIAKKQIPHWGICFFGAGDRTRTGTMSPSVDFESTTSTNSITPAGSLSIVQQTLENSKRNFEILSVKILPGGQRQTFATGRVACNTPSVASKNLFFDATARGH